MEVKTMIEDELQEMVLNMDGEELNALQRLIKARRRVISMDVLRTLDAGDRVKWTNRNGTEGRGTVKRVMIKNAVVQEDDGPRWRITASMLTKIDEDSGLINPKEVKTT
jgi:hypothetical protein